MRYYHEREDGLPGSAWPARSSGSCSSPTWSLLRRRRWPASGVAGASGCSLDRGYLTGAAADAREHVPHRLHVRAVSRDADARTRRPRYSAFTFARQRRHAHPPDRPRDRLPAGRDGHVLADLILTVVLLPLMWPWCRPICQRRCSRGRAAPGAALWPAARCRTASRRRRSTAATSCCSAGTSLPAELGVYQNGVTLGTGVAFFKSAFETAWAPFYYATARQPDAKDVFREDDDLRRRGAGAARRRHDGRRARRHACAC